MGFSLSDLNPVNAVEGAWSAAKKYGGKALNVIEHPGDALHSLESGLGIRANAPPSAADSIDATRTRNLANYFRTQSMNGPGGVAPTVTPTMLDQAQANQARGVQETNLGELHDVATGATTTPADAMYQRGVDAARANAMGTASAYSRGNPGLALKAGLNAGNQAMLSATSGAALQKAEEEAAARNQIGNLAGAMRTSDLNAAGANQGASNTAAAENQKANLEEQNLTNQYRLGMGGLAEKSTEAPLTAQIANQQIQEQQNQANQQGSGGFITGLGNFITKSDERTKERVRTSKLADAMAKHVRGVTFKYKPEYADGDTREHAGAMAQDIEKVVPGVVGKSPSGVKVVDTPHLTMANTGTIAELARRLRKVEKKAA